MATYRFLAQDGALYDVPEASFSEAISMGNTPIEASPMVTISDAAGATRSLDYTEAQPILASGAAKLAPYSQPIRFTGTDGHLYDVAPLEASQMFATGAKLFTKTEITDKAADPFMTADPRYPNFIGRALSVPAEQLKGGKEYLQVINRNKGGKAGFIEGFNFLDTESIPFVGGAIDAVEAGRIAILAKRLANGEASKMSDQDILDLNLFLAKTDREADASKLGKVGHVIKNSLVFGGEILASTFAGAAGWGVAFARKASLSTAEAAAVAAAKTTAGKFAREMAIKGAKDLSIRTGALLESKLGTGLASNIGKRTVASLARTLPGFTATTAVELAATSGDDEAGTLAMNRRKIFNALSGTNESDSKVFWAGLGDDFIEFFSETLGGHVTDAVGGALGKLSKSLEPGVVGKALKEQLEKWAGVSTSATTKEAFDAAFNAATRAKRIAGLGAAIAHLAVRDGINATVAMETLRKAGYDGVFGEFAEERIGGFLRGLLGIDGDADHGVLANAFDGLWPDDNEQIEVELMAFTAPYVAIGASYGLFNGKNMDRLYRRALAFSEMFETKINKARENPNAPIEVKSDKDSRAMLSDLLKDKIAFNSADHGVMGVVNSFLNLVGGFKITPEGLTTNPDLFLAAMMREPIGDIMHQVYNTELAKGPVTEASMAAAREFSVAMGSAHMQNTNDYVRLFSIADSNGAVDTDLLKRFNDGDALAQRMVDSGFVVRDPVTGQLQLKNFATAISELRNFVGPTRPEDRPAIPKLTPEHRFQLFIRGIHAPTTVADDADDADLMAAGYTPAELLAIRAYEGTGAELDNSADTKMHNLLDPAAVHSSFLRYVMFPDSITPQERAALVVNASGNDSQTLDDNIAKVRALMQKANAPLTEPVEGMELVHAQQPGIVYKVKAADETSVTVTDSAGKDYNYSREDFPRQFTKPRLERIVFTGRKSFMVRGRDRAAELVKARGYGDLKEAIASTAVRIVPSKVAGQEDAYYFAAGSYVSHGGRQLNIAQLDKPAYHIAEDAAESFVRRWNLAAGRGEFDVSELDALINPAADSVNTTIKRLKDKGTNEDGFNPRALSGKELSQLRQFERLAALLSHPAGRFELAGKVLAQRIMRMEETEARTYFNADLAILLATALDATNVGWQAEWRAFYNRRGLSNKLIESLGPAILGRAKITMDEADMAQGRPAVTVETTKKGKQHEKVRTKAQEAASQGAAATSVGAEPPEEEEGPEEVEDLDTEPTDDQLPPVNDEDGGPSEQELAAVFEEEEAPPAEPKPETAAEKRKAALDKLRSRKSGGAKDIPTLSAAKPEPTKEQKELAGWALRTALRLVERGYMGDADIEDITYALLKRAFFAPEEALQMITMYAVQNADTLEVLPAEAAYDDGEKIEDAMEVLNALRDSEAETDAENTEGTDEELEDSVGTGDDAGPKTEDSPSYFDTLAKSLVRLPEIQKVYGAFTLATGQQETTGQRIYNAVSPLTYHGKTPAFFYNEKSFIEWANDTEGVPTEIVAAGEAVVEDYKLLRSLLSVMPYHSALVTWNLLSNFHYVPVISTFMRGTEVRSKRLNKVNLLRGAKRKLIATFFDKDHGFKLADTEKFVQDLDAALKAAGFDSQSPSQAAGNALVFSVDTPKWNQIKAVISKYTGLSEAALRGHSKGLQDALKFMAYQFNSNKTATLTNFVSLYHRKKAIGESLTAADAMKLLQDSFLRPGANNRFPQLQSITNAISDASVALAWRDLFGKRHPSTVVTNQLTDLMLRAKSPMEAKAIRENLVEYVGHTNGTQSRELSGMNAITPEELFEDIVKMAFDGLTAMPEKIFIPVITGDKLRAMGVMADSARAFDGADAAWRTASAGTYAQKEAWYAKAFEGVTEKLFPSLRGDFKYWKQQDKANKRSSQVGTPRLRMITGVEGALPEKTRVLVFETAGYDGAEVIFEDALPMVKASMGLRPEAQLTTVKMGAYGVQDGEPVHIKPNAIVLAREFADHYAGKRMRAEKGKERNFSYQELYALGKKYKAHRGVSSQSAKALPKGAKVEDVKNEAGEVVGAVYEIETRLFGLIAKVDKPQGTEAEKAIAFQLITSISGSAAARAEVESAIALFTKSVERLEIDGKRLRNKDKLFQSPGKEGLKEIMGAVALQYPLINKQVLQELASAVRKRVRMRLPGSELIELAHEEESNLVYDETEGRVLIKLGDAGKALITDHTKSADGKTILGLVAANVLPTDYKVDSKHTGQEEGLAGFDNLLGRHRYTSEVLYFGIDGWGKNFDEVAATIARLQKDRGLFLDLADTDVEGNPVPGAVRTHELIGVTNDAGEVVGFMIPGSLILINRSPVTGVFASVALVRLGSRIPLEGNFIMTHYDMQARAGADNDADTRQFFRPFTNEDGAIFLNRSNSKDPKAISAAAMNRGFLRLLAVFDAAPGDETGLFNRINPENIGKPVQRELERGGHAKGTPTPYSWATWKNTWYEMLAANGAIGRAVVEVAALFSVLSKKAQSFSGPVFLGPEADFDGAKTWTLNPGSALEIKFENPRPESWPARLQLLADLLNQVVDAAKTPEISRHMALTPEMVGFATTIAAFIEIPAPADGDYTAAAHKVFEEAIAPFFSSFMRASPTSDNSIYRAMLQVKRTDAPATVGARFRLNKKGDPIPFRSSRVTPFVLLENEIAAPNVGSMTPAQKARLATIRNAEIIFKIAAAVTKISTGMNLFRKGPQTRNYYAWQNAAEILRAVAAPVEDTVGLSGIDEKDALLIPSTVYMDHVKREVFEPVAIDLTPAFTAILSARAEMAAAATEEAQKRIDARAATSADYLIRPPKAFFGQMESERNADRIKRRLFIAATQMAQGLTAPRSREETEAATFARYGELLAARPSNLFLLGLTNYEETDALTGAKKGILRLDSQIDFSPTGATAAGLAELQPADQLLFAEYAMWTYGVTLNPGTAAGAGNWLNMLPLSLHRRLSDAWMRLDAGLLQNKENASIPAIAAQANEDWFADNWVARRPVDPESQRAQERRDLGDNRAITARSAPPVFPAGVVIPAVGSAEAEAAAIAPVLPEIEEEEGLGETDIVDVPDDVFVPDEVSDDVDIPDEGVGPPEDDLSLSAAQAAFDEQISPLVSQEDFVGGIVDPEELYEAKKLYSLLGGDVTFSAAEIKDDPAYHFITSRKVFVINEKLRKVAVDRERKRAKARGGDGYPAQFSWTAKSGIKYNFRRIEQYGEKESVPKLDGDVLRPDPSKMALKTGGVGRIYRVTANLKIVRAFLPVATVIEAKAAYFDPVQFIKDKKVTKPRSAAQIAAFFKTRIEQAGPTFKRSIRLWAKVHLDPKMYEDNVVPPDMAESVREIVAFVDSLPDVIAAKLSASKYNPETIDSRAGRGRQQRQIAIAATSMDKPVSMDMALDVMNNLYARLPEGRKRSFVRQLNHDLLQVRVLGVLSGAAPHEIKAELNKALALLLNQYNVNPNADEILSPEWIGTASTAIAAAAFREMKVKAAEARGIPVEELLTLEGFSNTQTGHAYISADALLSGLTHALETQYMPLPDAPGDYHRDQEATVPRTPPEFRILAQVFGEDAVAPFVNKVINGSAEAVQSRYYVPRKEILRALNELRDHTIVNRKAQLKWVGGDTMTRELGPFLFPAAIRADVQLEEIAKRTASLLFYEHYVDEYGAYEHGIWLYKQLATPDNARRLRETQYRFFNTITGHMNERAEPLTGHLADIREGMLPRGQDTTQREAVAALNEYYAAAFVARQRAMAERNAENAVKIERLYTAPRGYTRAVDNLYYALPAPSPALLAPLLPVELPAGMTQIRSADGMIAEGKKMNHCVGGDQYIWKGLRGDSIFLHIDTENSPQGLGYTAEIHYPGGELGQMNVLRGYYNEAAPENINEAFRELGRKFAQAWAKDIEAKTRPALEVPADVAAAAQEARERAAAGGALAPDNPMGWIPRLPPAARPGVDNDDAGFSLARMSSGTEASQKAITNVVAKTIKLGADISRAIQGRAPEDEEEFWLEWAEGQGHPRTNVELYLRGVDRIKSTIRGTSFAEKFRAVADQAFGTDFSAKWMANIDTDAMRVPEEQQLIIALEALVEYHDLGSPLRLEAKDDGSPAAAVVHIIGEFMREIVAQSTIPNATSGGETFSAASTTRNLAAGAMALASAWGLQHLMSDRRNLTKTGMAYVMDYIGEIEGFRAGAYPDVNNLAVGFGQQLSAIEATTFRNITGKSKAAVASGKVRLTEEEGRKLAYFRILQDTRHAEENIPWFKASSDDELKAATLWLYYNGVYPNNYPDSFTALKAEDYRKAAAELRDSDDYRSSKSGTPAPSGKQMPGGYWRHVEKSALIYEAEADHKDTSTAIDRITGAVREVAEDLGISFSAAPPMRVYHYTRGFGGQEEFLFDPDVTRLLSFTQDLGPGLYVDENPEAWKAYVQQHKIMSKAFGGQLPDWARRGAEKIGAKIVGGTVDYSHLRTPARQMLSFDVDTARIFSWGTYVSPEKVRVALGAAGLEQFMPQALRLSQALENETGYFGATEVLRILGYDTPLAPFFSALGYDGSRDNSAGTVLYQRPRGAATGRRDVSFSAAENWQNLKSTPQALNWTAWSKAAFLVRGKLGSGVSPDDPIVRAKYAKIRELWENHISGISNVRYLEELTPALRAMTKDARLGDARLTEDEVDKISSVAARDPNIESLYRTIAEQDTLAAAERNALGLAYEDTGSEGDIETDGPRASLPTSQNARDLSLSMARWDNTVRDANAWLQSGTPVAHAFLYDMMNLIEKARQDESNYIARKKRIYGNDPKTTKLERLAPDGVTLLRRGAIDWTQEDHEMVERFLWAATAAAQGGDIVYHDGKNMEGSTLPMTETVAEFTAMWDTSQTKGKLLAAGRTADMLDPVKLGREDMARRYEMSRREVNDATKWIFLGDEFLKEWVNYAPQFYGEIGFLDHNTRQAADDVAKLVSERKFHASPKDTWLDKIEDAQVFEYKFKGTRPPEATQSQKLLYNTLTGRVFAAGTTVAQANDAIVEILRRRQLNHAKRWRENPANAKKRYVPVDKEEEKDLSTIAALEKAMSHYRHKEWTHRADKRYYATYSEAAEMTEGELIPQTMNILDLRLRYVNDVYTTASRRALTNMLLMAPDINGAPLLIANPNLQNSDPHALIEERTWLQAASRLADYLGIILDASKPILPQYQNMVDNYLSTEDYEVVEAPYDSIKEFRVRKGDAARILKHVVGKPTQKFLGSWNYLQSLSTVTQWTKHMSLGYSLFFAIALMESLIAGTGLKNNILWRLFKRDENPMKRMLQLHKGLKNYDPAVVDMLNSFVRNGARIGENAVTDENDNAVDAAINSWADRVRFASNDQSAERFKTFMRAISGRYLSDKMFSMFTTMKLWAAEDLYLNMKMKMGPGVSESKIKRIIAPIINDAYGGQAWTKYLWATPKMRQIMNGVLFAPNWCVSVDTQALTKVGWKKHSELDIGDEIMVFDPKAGKTRWGRLLDKFERMDYSGDIINVRNLGRDIKMTPEHTCPVVDTHGAPRVIKANELTPKYRIPRVAEFHVFPAAATIPDRLVRIIGWFVTDGHLNVNRKTRASGEKVTHRSGRIAQSKPEMVKRILELGLKYHVRPRKDTNFKCNYDCYIFTIRREELEEIERLGVKDGKLSWDFIAQLTREQLELLEETMMFGDGTGQNRFCGEEEEVFYMTLIRTLLGKPCTFYEQKQEGAWCWRTRSITSKTISCQKGAVSRTRYDGGIWCPSVDTGFWVAERDGLIFITGNTLSAWNVAGGGALSGRILRNYQGVEHRDFVWFRNWPAMLLIALGIIPTAIQALIYAASGDPDKGDKLLNIMNEEGKRAHIDLTPIVRNFPWYKGAPSGSRRFYMRFGKQAFEVVGPNGWLGDAPNQFLRKMSLPAKYVYEIVTGTSPGSGDWDLEFKGKGWMGWIHSGEPGFKGLATSRLGYLGQKIIPMSFLSIGQTGDAAPLNVFAPISKGKSFQASVEAVVMVMNTYADQDSWAKVRVSPKYRVALANLAPSVLDAAHRNGIETDKVISAAKGVVLKRLYNEFWKALDKQDEKRLDEVANSVLRVGGSLKGMKASARNRSAQFGQEYTPEMNAAIEAALR